MRQQGVGSDIEGHAEQRIGAMMNARWNSKPAPYAGEEGSAQAHGSADERSPDEQGSLASADAAGHQDDNPGQQPGTGGSKGTQDQDQQPPRPRRHRAEEQARHVNVRDNGTTRSFPDRG